MSDVDDAHVRTAPDDYSVTCGNEAIFQSVVGQ